MVRNKIEKDQHAFVISAIVFFESEEMKLFICKKQDILRKVSGHSLYYQGSIPNTFVMQLFENNALGCKQKNCLFPRAFFKKPGFVRKRRFELPRPVKGATTSK